MSNPSRMIHECGLSNIGPEVRRATRPQWVAMLVVAVSIWVSISASVRVRRRWETISTVTYATATATMTSGADRRARPWREQPRDHDRREGQPQHGDAMPPVTTAHGLRLGEAGQVRGDQPGDGAEEQRREGRAAAEAPERDAPGEALEEDRSSSVDDRERAGDARRARRRRPAPRTAPRWAAGRSAWWNAIASTPTTRPAAV